MEHTTTVSEHGTIEITLEHGTAVIGGGRIAVIMPATLTPDELRDTLHTLGELIPGAVAQNGGTE